MCRFYRKHPELLRQLYREDKKFMWSKVSQIAQEAASNPQVQTAATLVTGAVAWKALDVWESYKQEAITEMEIAAENKRHDEQLAEMKATRLEENRRHEEEMSMREKELESSKNSSNS